MKLLFLMILVYPLKGFCDLSVYVYDSEFESFKGTQSNDTSEVFLDEYFESSSIYNYFENTALNSYQSLFLDGVDQRFLELDYNGFSLRDPSHPSGIFNVSSILSSTGSRSVSNKAVRLSINNKHEEKSFFSLSVSQLGEAHTAFQKNLCESRMCYNAGMSLKRGGGFSQKSGGEEDDYFKRMDLSFSSTKYQSSYEDQTYILYSGQQYDEDSVGLFLEDEPESLNAMSEGTTFFIGKVYKFKEFSLRASFLSSYRSQSNPGVDLKFSQRGEVFEVEGEYKNLSLKVFNERYDLFLNSGMDKGASLNFTNSVDKIEYSVDLGITSLRGGFGAVELEYEGLGFFGKAVQASLFQSSLNEQNGFSELKTQNIFGVRYVKNLIKKESLRLGVRASYSRTFDFIDYDLLSNSYKNLDEIESALLKLEFNYLWVGLFAQYQISRNISEGLSLSRIPDWTLGLNIKKELIKDLMLSSSIEFVGERRAFDRSALESFWGSSAALTYKGVTLSATNVFGETTNVYKGLGRRPLTLELKYQKTF